MRRSLACLALSLLASAAPAAAQSAPSADRLKLADLHRLGEH